MPAAILAALKAAAVIGPDAVKLAKGIYEAWHEQTPFTPEVIAAIRSYGAETAEEIDARQFPQP